MGGTGSGTGPRGMGTARRLVALGALVAVLAGCGDATVTPSPSPPASTGPTPTTAPPTTGSPSAGPSAGPTSSPLSAPPTSTPVPAPARWEQAGSLASLTGVDGIAALGDGSALVVGAMRNHQTGAERWDPASGSWQVAEGLNKARTSFAMVGLRDGRALVIGGLNDSDQSFSSAYAYDPATGHWSKTGLMTAARTMPAATVLADGRVLVAGGYYAHQPDFGLLEDSGVSLAAYRPTDPATGERSTPDDIAPPNVGNALATAELFDPATGEWSETGHLRYARSGARAVTLADGRVLVVGSSPGPEFLDVGLDGHAFETAELYDPATGSFTLTGSLPAIDPAEIAGQGAPGFLARELADGGPDAYGIGSLVALDDGDAVLIGSTYGWKHGADFTRSFRYHAASGSWTQIGPTWLSAERPNPPYAVWTSSGPNLDGAAAAPLPDGRILSAGGGGYDPGTRTVLAYNPAKDAWANLPRLPDVRTGGMATVLGDGSVLIVGGNGNGRSAVRFVPRR